MAQHFVGCNSRNSFRISEQDSARGETVHDRFVKKDAVQQIETAGLKRYAIREAIVSQFARGFERSD